MGSATLNLPLLRVSRRTRRVWQRNFDVFLRLWKTESWPPFVEPVLYLLAMGLGLGGYVGAIEGLPFLHFLAPAFIATAAMFIASFECLYGSFVRMQYQKTFEAILSTPLNVEEVIFGEILWGASRATFAAAGVLVVISFFGVTQSWWALLALPAAFLCGLLFASLAMICTALAPSIDSFNYYITLGLTPMFLFSGVFFPVSSLPPAFQVVAWFSPLTHAVNLQRGLVLGHVEATLWFDVLWLLVAFVPAANLALALMARRIIQ